MLNGVNVLRVVNEARGVNLERVLRRNGGEVVSRMRRLGDAPELGFAANFKAVRAVKKPLIAVTEGISGIIISYFTLGAGAREAQRGARQANSF